MSPRIFLVEDDEVVIRTIQEGMAREKWAFQTSRMISGAVEALRSFTPDMLLLDLSLPDGDGLDVCRQLRADKALAGVPVIILTSKGEVDSRLKGFEAGAQDYVIKPFVMPELLARVKAHLALKQGREALEKELVERRLHERVRQDVIDMIVHDLRSPLTTAKITLDLCRESNAVGKSFSKYLQYADSALDFTLFMVNDLLDLGAESIIGEARPVDLGDLSARLNKLLSVRFKAKGVALRFEFPRKSPEFASDPVLIFRILVNLLDNALKCTPARGKIVVKARATPAGLRVEVVDSGSGIPDAEKEAVFLKFYRARETKAKAIPGHGIGLAFCRLAAQALRGRIWVEDAEDGGSAFILELPALAPGTKLSAGPRA